jgi:hypothetical protein
MLGIPRTTLSKRLDRAVSRLRHVLRAQGFPATLAWIIALLSRLPAGTGVGVCADGVGGVPGAGSQGTGIRPSVRSCTRAAPSPAKTSLAFSWLAGSVATVAIAVLAFPGHARRDLAEPVRAETASVE